MRKSVFSSACFQVAVIALAVLFPVLTGCSKSENPTSSEPVYQEMKPTVVDEYQKDMDSMPDDEEIVLLPADTKADAETADTDAAASADTASEAVPATDGLVKVVKPENKLDELVGSAPIVLIDFNATWCGPCKRLGPYIERMADTFKDKGVSCYSADVDEVQSLAQELGVSSIPDVRIYVNGKPYETQVGCEPIELFGKLESAVAAANQPQ